MQNSENPNQQGHYGGVVRGLTSTESICENSNGSDQDVQISA